MFISLKFSLAHEYSRWEFVFVTEAIELLAKSGSAATNEWLTTEWVTLKITFHLDRLFFVCGRQLIFLQKNMEKCDKN